MSRGLLVLWNDAMRAKAIEWVRRAPAETRLTFQAPRRTLPQNSRMWAMLTDLAGQLPWHGVKLAPDDWKVMFLDALNREVRAVPALDGRGFVNLGRSSSELGVEEMANLIELMFAFGAEHGVVWMDPKEKGRGV